MRALYTIFICLLAVAVSILSPVPALADGGSLFFTAIVEHDNSGNPQAALEWGALEGELPAAITTFRVYRSENGAAHVLVAEIPRALADPAAINTMIKSDIPVRSLRLTSDLQRMNSSVTDYPAYLYSLLDEQAADHDPFRAMLLSRAHLTAARALGLGFIDQNISSSSSYQYLLTAVTAGGETLPIGQSSTLNPATETILPAPTGFKQVLLSSCSPMAAGLDDNQIHMTWDISDAPQDMGLKLITYGYDLFWSATDQGTVDFRTAIPAQLHRVTQESIVVSGPAPESGPDGFLARDGRENHLDTEPAWERGRQFYYYLAARDIFGHYCAPVAPVMFTVVDAMPPHAIWNGHAMEIKDPADNLTPRLALAWDAPTAVNFSRYYGSNRTYCSADTESICWVGPDQSCATDTLRCADLAVSEYRVFRFDSAADAAAWGIDSDGDGWPDNLENPDQVCNKDLPADLPPQWIATIDPDDGAFSRDLSPTHRQILFIDSIADNMIEKNQVYWYRVIAVDKEGNQSPVSPPLRGVLYDRDQPAVGNADLSILQCSYTAQEPADCTDLQPQADDIYILHDLTGDAASYKLLRLCGVNAGTGPILGMLDSGGFDSSGVAGITGDKLPNDNCAITPCNGFGTFVVRFYDADGSLLAQTDYLDLKDACNFKSCITLDKTCDWVVTNDPFPVVEGPVRVCVTLQQGESARVYYQVPDGMSAFATFPPGDIGSRRCRQFDDLPGLSPADVCLGIRVFSDQHVGSMLHNLGCLELHDRTRQPLPVPLLDTPEPERNADGDFFNLHWSIPAAGISAYILKISSPGSPTSYVNLWQIEADDTGKYPYHYPLAPEDLGREWCFKLRAQTTDMQVSDWSGEQCATWQLTPPENLPWPPVQEPESVGSESLGAFFLATDGDHRPVLVLSDDLAAEIADISCESKIPYCDMHTYGTIGEPGVSPCIRDNELTFYACPACSMIATKVIAANFIIYRQKSGHDFVQISPLVEGFHCLTDFTDKDVAVDHLQDPFITIMNLAQEVVTGVDDPAATGTGTRILFKDRYPCKTGSSLRYKLVSFNPETGEPEKIYTSNWLTVP